MIGEDEPCMIISDHIISLHFQWHRFLYYIFIVAFITHACSFIAGSTSTQANYLIYHKLYASPPITGHFCRNGEEV